MKQLTRLAGWAFVLPLLVAADHDTTKLPEGSVWKGTYKVLAKDKIVSSTGIEIKITKRAGTTFEGVWTNTNNGHNVFEINGTIATNKLSFKAVTQVEGKDAAAVIDTLRASGQLAVREGATTIKGTITSPNFPDLTGYWEATLKTE